MLLMGMVTGRSSEDLQVLCWNPCKPVGNSSLKNFQNGGPCFSSRFKKVCGPVLGAVKGHVLDYMSISNVACCSPSMALYPPTGPFKQEPRFFEGKPLEGGYRCLHSLTGASGAHAPPACRGKQELGSSKAWLGT